jgi:hypothetical protein
MFPIDPSSTFSEKPETLWRVSIRFRKFPKETRGNEKKTRSVNAMMAIERADVKARNLRVMISRDLKRFATAAGAFFHVGCPLQLGLQIEHDQRPGGQDHVDEEGKREVDVVRDDRGGQNVQETQEVDLELVPVGLGREKLDHLQVDHELDAVPDQVLLAPERLVNEINDIADGRAVPDRLGDRDHPGEAVAEYPVGHRGGDADHHREKVGAGDQDRIEAGQDEKRRAEMQVPPERHSAASSFGPKERSAVPEPLPDSKSEMSTTPSEAGRGGSFKCCSGGCASARAVR